MASDDLGDRLKRKYENVTRFYLPSRTYTVIRLDGNAFHTYTRQFNKPFDDRLYQAFSYAIGRTLPHLHGSCLAYHQSDEISFLLTDFNEIHTEPWFGGNLQKMASVSASMITAYFNDFMDGYVFEEGKVQKNSLAFFDSRVFTINDPWEVSNYFIWRQKDAIRNAIRSIGHVEFGHSAMQNLSIRDLILKLANERSIDPFIAYPLGFLNGQLFYKKLVLQNDDASSEENYRLKWHSEPAFNFVQSRKTFHDLIPTLDISIFKSMP